MKLQDMNLTNQVTGHEIAGHEIARHDREVHIKQSIRALF